MQVLRFAPPISSGSKSAARVAPQILVRAAGEREDIRLIFANAAPRDGVQLDSRLWKTDAQRIAHRLPDARRKILFTSSHLHKRTFEVSFPPARLLHVGGARPRLVVIVDFARLAAGVGRDSGRIRTWRQLASV